MIGFVIGAVCAIGLVRMVRRARRYHGRFAPYASGCRGGGKEWVLRSVLERLDTTPEQERAVVDALRGVYGDRKEVFDELVQTRSEMAQALEGGLLDDAAFEETFARHDRLLARVRVSVVEALKKVADTLDDRQRKLLAGFLRGGRWFGAGPYRSVWV